MSTHEDRHLVLKRQNDYRIKPTKELRPPSKDSRGKPTKSLFVPDIYPQTATQSEDVLNQRHIQKGYLNPQLNERVEVGSAHKHRGRTPRLSKSIVDNFEIIRALHAANRKLINPKDLPSRQHNLMNQEGLKKWMGNLADTRYPMGQLAKKTPQLKNHQIMQYLYDKDITCVRGCWYIKVHLKNEIMKRRKAQRTKEETIDDFTENGIMKFLGDQLNGISNYDSQDCENDFKKWDYCLRFLIHITGEGLTSPTVICTWFIEQLKSVNNSGDWRVCSIVVSALYNFLCYFLAQQEYTRSLLLRCCTLLTKLCGVGTVYNPSEHPSYSYNIYASLCTFIQVMVMESPASLVSWCLQQKFNDLSFRDLLLKSTIPPCFSPSFKKYIETIFAGVNLNIQERTEILQPNRSVPTGATQLGSYSILNALDSFPVYSDNQETKQSNNGSLNNPTIGTLEWLFNIVFKSKNETSWAWFQSEQETLEVECSVNLLCQWAVTVYRPSSHRILVVISLLSLLNKITAFPKRTTNQKYTALHHILMNILDNYKWPEQVQEEHKKKEFNQLVVLYGELIRESLFDYNTYVISLISRGYLSFRPKSLDESSDSVAQFHRDCIRNFPCFANDIYIRNLRRCLLFDVSLSTDDCYQALKISDKIKNCINRAQSTSVSTPTTSSTTFTNENNKFTLKHIYYYYPYYANYKENDIEDDYRNAKRMDKKEKKLMYKEFASLSCIYQRDISAWLFCSVQHFVTEIDTSLQYLTVTQLSEIIGLFSIIKDYTSMFCCLKLVVEHSSNLQIHCLCVHAIQAHWNSFVTCGQVSVKLFNVIAKNIADSFQLGNGFKSSAERIVACFVQDALPWMERLFSPLNPDQKIRQLVTNFYRIKAKEKVPVNTEASPHLFSAAMNQFPNLPNDISIITNKCTDKKGVQSFLACILDKFRDFDSGNNKKNPVILSNIIQWSSICAKINDNVYMNSIILKLMKDMLTSNAGVPKSSWSIGSFLVCLCARNCLLLSDFLKEVMLRYVESLIDRAREQPQHVKQGIHSCVELMRCLLIDYVFDNNNNSMSGSDANHEDLEEFQEIDRLSVVSSIKTMNINVIMPLVAKLYLLKGLMAKEKESSLIQLLLVDVVTVNWFRVKCLRDTDKLYTDYLKKYHETNDMTIKDMRNILRLLAYGKNIFDSEKETRAKDGIRQVEAVFEHLNRWTFRSARLELQLLCDEWKELKQDESVTSIVQLVYKKLVEETTNGTNDNAVIPFALCLTPQVQLNLVIEAARMLNNDKNENKRWWTIPLISQICPEKEIHLTSLEAKKLDTQFGNLLIPCLQKDVELSTKFSVMLQEQFSLYVEDRKQKVCVADNGLSLRLELLCSLIPTILQKQVNCKCQEWLQVLCLLLKQELAVSDHLVNHLCTRIFDILSSLLQGFLANHASDKKRLSVVSGLKNELSNLPPQSRELCDRLFPLPSAQVQALEIGSCLGSEASSDKISDTIKVTSTDPYYITIDKGSKGFPYEIFQGTRIERTWPRFRRYYAMAQHHNHAAAKEQMGSNVNNINMYSPGDVTIISGSPNVRANSPNPQIRHSVSPNIRHNPSPNIRHSNSPNIHNHNRSPNVRNLPTQSGASKRHLNSNDMGYPKKGR